MFKGFKSITPSAAEFWYLSAKLIPGACSLLAVAVFVRLLGEQGYATLSLFLAATIFASTVGAGWIRQALLRAAGSHRLSDLPKALMAATLVSSAGLMLLIIQSTGLTRSGAVTVLAGVALASAVTWQSTVLADVQAAGAFREYTRLEALRAIGGLLLAILFSISYPDPAAVLLAFATAGLLGSYCRPSVRSTQRRRLSNRDAGNWWRYGWPMAAWLACAIVLQLSDRFLIAYLIGVKDAGYYAALYDIVNRGVSMVMIPLTLAAHPVIMRLYNQRLFWQAISECKRLLLRQLIVASCVVIAMTTAAGILLKVSGVTARGNDTVLIGLLALSAALWQIGLVLHKPMELGSETRRLLVFILTATSANIAANLLLLATLGLMFAAMSSVGGSLIYIGFTSWRLRKTVRGIVEGADLGPTHS